MVINNKLSLYKLHEIVIQYQYINWRRSLQLLQETSLVAWQYNSRSFKQLPSNVSSRIVEKGVSCDTRRSMQFIITNTAMRFCAYVHLYVSAYSFCVYDGRMSKTNLTGLLNLRLSSTLTINIINHHQRQCTIFQFTFNVQVY